VNPTKFLTEVKRRNVYRAAVAYGVVVWFPTQLTTQVFPFFEVPNSAVRFVVIALAVGFLIAMLLAWVYEFTPKGIVRTEAQFRGSSIFSRFRRSNDAVIRVYDADGNVIETHEHAGERGDQPQLLSMSRRAC
jgi:hypothetical protein